MTTRRLTSVDRRLALVFDSGVLQILDIDEETDLKLSTDGDSLVMTPIRAKGRKHRFHAALDAVVREYDGMFREMVE